VDKPLGVLDIKYSNRPWIYVWGLYICILDFS
jgi:hypothetical protein